jgi:WD40 repeat protein
VNALEVGVIGGADRIVAAGRDGTVRIWDADGGEELRTLRGHSDLVDAVANDVRTSMRPGEGSSANRADT